MSTEQAEVWREVRTTEPERAHAYCARVFTDHAVALSGSRERFAFVHRHADLGRHFSVHQLRHSMDTRTEVEPLGQILVNDLHSGRVGITAAREQIAASAGDVYLQPPDRRFQASWRGLCTGMVSLGIAEVSDYAEDMSGRPTGPLRFHRLEPVTPTMAGHWRATVDYVTGGLLANPELVGNELLLGQAFRKLAAALLATFPNTATSRPPQPRGQVSPAALRRAVQFLESHAHTDVTPAQAAHAGGTSPTHLEDGLAAREQTFAERLERARLDGAHRDLQDSDPATGESVAQIAARWGFVDPAQFAIAYRRVYRHPPEHTRNR